MTFRLLLGRQNLRILTFTICFSMVGCASSYLTYSGKAQPGRLNVVSIPGSCYYYVKDTLTQMCWLSCFDQSMLRDEKCKHYDKAFAARATQAAEETSLNDSQGSEAVSETEAVSSQAETQKESQVEKENDVDGQLNPETE